MIPVNSLTALLTDSPISEFLSSLHWHGSWNLRDTEGVIVIISVVSAWITGLRMRRKIRQDLGRKATDADLTSIDTWMKVDEVEQQKKRNRPVSPDWNIHFLKGGLPVLSHFMPTGSQCNPHIGGGLEIRTKTPPLKSIKDGAPKVLTQRLGHPPDDFLNSHAPMLASIGGQEKGIWSLELRDYQKAPHPEVPSRLDRAW